MRIEAAQNIEDELRVSDVATDIAERVGGGLHPLAVVVDGGVALGHGVELVLRKMARGALLASKRRLMATQSSRVVWFGATARPRTSGPTEPRSQLRTQESAMAQAGSVGLASAVSSTCGRRPNFPQREVKNGSHWLKLGCCSSRVTGM
jgi:hypothetical protein